MTVWEFYENLLVAAREIALLTEQVKELALWETNWLDANIWLVVFAVFLHGQYVYATYQNYVSSEDILTFTIMQSLYMGALYIVYKLLTVIL